jgi:phage shock protein PspC (stress-responsive transcriptional regulator)
MEPMNDENGAGPRRLSRSQEGRLLTGVCAGLARYTRIDPIVFRVGFGLLVITTGVGIILYIGAFLLMAAPDGGPSKIERLGKRILDGDTVLALLGAALACGTTIGVIGHWGSGDALAVVVVFGLALLAARSRGVDLVSIARGLPERVKGVPLSSWTPPPAPADHRLPEGMVDLARLGRRSDAGTAPTPAEKEPAGVPEAEPAGTVPHRRRRSYLTALTLVAAALSAAILYALTGDRPGFGEIQIVLAGALAVVAIGILIGAWFGRDRKLVTVGAIMSLALAATSIAGNSAVARRTHHATWRPTAVAQAEHTHKVLIGEGVVDLTGVPLGPGERIEVSAEVMLGVLAVKVPSTARVEVDGHALLGDITVDRQVTSGPGARVRRVLEPEEVQHAPAGPKGRRPGAPPAAPSIVLRIRSKVGDMEVIRVPA